MRIFKKFFVVLLVGLLTVSLSACNSSNTTTDSSSIKDGTYTATEIGRASCRERV